MITDLEARKIASAWHGGQGTALYALSSTGAINTARDDHDVAAEITECAREVHKTDRAEDDMAFTNLIELRTYTQRQGTRGPVDGWSKLTW